MVVVPHVCRAGLREAAPGPEISGVERYRDTGNGAEFDAGLVDMQMEGKEDRVDHHKP